MNKGTYPTYWKVSQISPIFKDGNISDVNCYRHRSHLNCMSKVLEKIIFDEIYELLRHKLCENQFGSRKNRSATLQLLLFLDTVYKKFDNEAIKDLSILYIDFAKALDTVPHNILIQKLYNIGVGGKLIQLISSFLTNRKQYVKINNEESDLIEVSSGVPQGSILGPLFFIIFIKHLAEHLTEVICYGFSDDLNLISEKQCNTETAVSSLSTWRKENQMRLNFNKTHLLNIKGNTTESIDNHKPDQVENQRHLELQVLENLNWNENCSFRKRRGLSAFFKLKSNISQKCEQKSNLNTYIN